MGARVYHSVFIVCLLLFTFAGIVCAMEILHARVTPHRQSSQHKHDTTDYHFNLSVTFKCDQDRHLFAEQIDNLLLNFETH